MKNNHFMYKKNMTLNNIFSIGTFEAYTNLTWSLGDFNGCFIELEIVIKDILNIWIVYKNWIKLAFFILLLLPISVFRTRNPNTL